MNRKRKGFSLAELLISLLIISIVLSAAIPTITKRTGASRENIWNWSDQNNSIYTASGTNQSAIIGINRVPDIKWNDILKVEKDIRLTTLDDVSNAKSVAAQQFSISDDQANRVSYSSDGNKLVILKRQSFPGESDFINSHIAFYNTTSDTTRGVNYSGRITMDPGNIAIGIGALQTQRPTSAIKSDESNSTTVVGENTAIGHFALLQNTAGERNTAIGKKTLTRNVEGSYNTAVGFGALFDYDSKKFDMIGVNDNKNGAIPAKPKNANNTAIGALAQQHNSMGESNTSLGYMALGSDKMGNHNTAIGNMALAAMSDTDELFNATLTNKKYVINEDTGETVYKSFNNYNVAVGDWACGFLGTGSNNICIGYGAGFEKGGGVNGDGSFNTRSFNDSLFIGQPYIKYPVNDTNKRYNQPSLITGHTQYGSDILDANKQVTASDRHNKELIVNARTVMFKSPMGGENKDALFTFDSYSGLITNDSNGCKTTPINGSPFCGYSPLLKEGEGFKGFFGIANFNLRNNGTNDAITLRFVAPKANHTAYIYSLSNEQNTPLPPQTLKDFSFNNMLTIDFPNKELGNEKDTDNTKKMHIFKNAYSEKVAIRAESLPDAVPDKDGMTDNNYNEVTQFPLVLNDLWEIDSKNKRIQVNAPESSTGTWINLAHPIIIEAKNKNEYSLFVGNDDNKDMFSLKKEAGKYNLDFKSLEGSVKFNLQNGYIDINTVSSRATDSILNLTNGSMTITNGFISMGSSNPNADIYFPYDLYSAKNIKGAFKNIRDDIQRLREGPSSDIRLKNVSGDSTAGLKEINALEVKNYTYKKDEKKVPHVGVIAQQLQKIFPDAVSKDEEGYLRIRTEDIFYAMVNSIKELCKQLQDLTAKVTGLDKRITELEKQNKQLAEQNKAFEKRLAKLEKEAAKNK
ncbi:tail fiber domain-containing protein [bacterium]|nr:tail fiber domain-containing protein [bacterium]